MHVRKIHEVGNGALAVTLPINECRKMGYGPHTYMMIENIENKIVLTPISAGDQTNTETGAATIPRGECAND